MSVERRQLKSFNCSLRNFTYSKDSDYIIVTEWANGDGWDITINDKQISLHNGELVAINYLTTMLDYDYESKLN